MGDESLVESAEGKPKSVYVLDMGEQTDVVIESDDEVAREKSGREIG